MPVKGAGKHGHAAQVYTPIPGAARFAEVLRGVSFAPRLAR